MRKSIIKSKCLLAFGSLILIPIALSACATTNSDATVTAAPAVDTSKPVTYEQYKAWRDRYDPQAKEYAEFKEWEAQYRRWQWEQQKQSGR